MAGGLGSGQESSSLSRIRFTLSLRDTSSFLMLRTVDTSIAGTSLPFTALKCGTKCILLKCGTFIR